MSEKLERLEERLKRIAGYHIKEYAKRLDEVGGPGVGGTELDVKIPYYEVITLKQDVKKLTKEDINKQKINALSESIGRLWGEAAWSYVYGHFRGCITLLAILTERALKLKLEQEGLDTKGKTLGHCISCCQCKEILPSDVNDETMKAINFVNQKRNDVVHANIELKRPESLLTFKASEHEIVSMSEMPDEIRKCICTENGKRTYLPPEAEQKASVIYEYKKAAKDTLNETKKVLQFLFQKS